MKTVWLTYSWEDNHYQQVDYVAQELTRIGFEVKLDKWNIQAGQRLSEQIARFIDQPEASDAWILYATQHSLGSEESKQAYLTALNEATSKRGAAFPTIAVFPASIDNRLISPDMRNRLNVSLRDHDWKERIVAAVEGRHAVVDRPVLEPYILQIHETPDGIGKFAIEVGPRAGTWSPFVLGIPVAEQEAVHLQAFSSPRGVVPTAEGTKMSGFTSDGQWWYASAQHEASPTQSYFAFCNVLPSRLLFGSLNQTQHVVDVEKLAT